MPISPNAESESGIPILPQFEEERAIIYPRFGSPVMYTNKLAKISKITMAINAANMKVVMADMSSRRPSKPTKTRQGAPRFILILVRKSVGKAYSLFTQIKPIREINKTG